MGLPGWRLNEAVSFGVAEANQHFLEGCVQMD